MQSLLIFIFFFKIFLTIQETNGELGILTLKMHHRFSDPFNSNHHFPAKGSVEYYSQLAHHDVVLRGRKLSDSGEQLLTFSDGNSSFRISSLGL